MEVSHERDNRPPTRVSGGAYQDQTTDQILHEMGCTLQFRLGRKFYAGVKKKSRQGYYKTAASGWGQLEPGRLSPGRTGRGMDHVRGEKSKTGSNDDTVVFLSHRQ